jgi:hypothetical protein
MVTWAIAAVSQFRRELNGKVYRRSTYLPGLLGETITFVFKILRLRYHCSLECLRGIGVGFGHFTKQADLGI